ncbi:hypothetical protein EVG20_g8172 [Dentipellis fragilis]|uniref:Uncharacterized protein n=1 Tax=Dentipellis fragilis TaxID=205917 RepID=A0A4Y9Y796_9AGAM|nr:hypothetical protein EVG20_g8172 [Dentipellis fragilis]
MLRLDRVARADDGHRHPTLLSNPVAFLLRHDITPSAEPLDIRKASPRPPRFVQLALPRASISPHPSCEHFPATGVPLARVAVLDYRPLASDPAFRHVDTHPPNAAHPCSTIRCPTVPVIDMQTVRELHCVAGSRFPTVLRLQRAPTRIFGALIRQRASSWDCASELISLHLFASQTSVSVKCISRSASFMFPVNKFEGRHDPDDKILPAQAARLDRAASPAGSYGQGTSVSNVHEGSPRNNEARFWGAIDLAAATCPRPKLLDPHGPTAIYLEQTVLPFSNAAIDGAAVTAQRGRWRPPHSSRGLTYLSPSPHRDACAGATRRAIDVRVARCACKVRAIGVECSHQSDEPHSVCGTPFSPARWPPWQRV